MKLTAYEACQHANSTLTHVACAVITDVETVWEDVSAFCGKGVCEAVEAFAAHDVREDVVEHCNASLVRREANCAEADALIASPVH